LIKLPKQKKKTSSRAKSGLKAHFHPLPKARKDPGRVTEGPWWLALSTEREGSFAAFFWPWQEIERKKKK